MLDTKYDPTHIQKKHDDKVKEREAMEKEVAEVKALIEIEIALCESLLESKRKLQKDINSQYLDLNNQLRSESQKVNSFKKKLASQFEAKEKLEHTKVEAEMQRANEVANGITQDISQRRA